MTRNYLAIKAIKSKSNRKKQNDVTIYINCGKLAKTQKSPIKYSKDKRKWKSLDKDIIGTTIELKEGEVCYFRNNDTDLPLMYFRLSGKTRISGNIMSLLDKTCQSTEITKPYQFKELFADNENLMDISDLSLPAVTLSEGCYKAMFRSCEKLIYDEQILPAYDVPKEAYAEMFADCEQILKTAQICARTVHLKSMFGMYKNCASLNKACTLYPEQAAPECYALMFLGTNLTSTPSIMLKTTASRCCASMFAYCDKLIAISENFYFNHIRNYALYRMFCGCDRLRRAAKYISEEICVDEGGMTDMYSYCQNIVSPIMLPHIEDRNSRELVVSQICDITYSEDHHKYDDVIGVPTKAEKEIEHVTRHVSVIVL